jgi:hypothetical protein
MFRRKGRERRIEFRGNEGFDWPEVHHLGVLLELGVERRNGRFKRFVINDLAMELEDRINDLLCPLGQSIDG